VSDKLVRVLLVDDHPKVRLSLKMSLEIWGDVEVVGEAGSGLEAIRLVSDTQPDVVLMDLDMPGMDGAEAAKVISEQNTGVQILILTGTADYDRINTALAAGAKDFLLKTAHVEEIWKAVVGAAQKNAS
jgi:DNA-binding NarL/FixJ family response regulator